MTNCKQCKSENIKSFNEIENVLYKGDEIQVPIEYSICDECGREFISKSQILSNEVAFKKDKQYGISNQATRTYDMDTGRKMSIVGPIAADA